MAKLAKERITPPLPERYVESKIIAQVLERYPDAESSTLLLISPSKCNKNFKIPLFAPVKRKSTLCVYLPD